MASNRVVKIKIGEQELEFQAESKKAIDTEILLFHIPLIATILLYAFHILSCPLFFVLFYVLAMRIFIGNHDRYHASTSERLPRLLEILSEELGIVVTPWDEPFDSIQKKHLAHHATHKADEHPIYDTKLAPHCIYELGGIFKVLLSCLFYEEIQLLFDIRDNNLTKSRLNRFIFYFPVLVAFIYFFGWAVWFGVFIAMRIVGFTAWFVFSWVIHQPFVYKFGFSKNVPGWFKFIFLVLHGRRGSQRGAFTILLIIPGLPYQPLSFTNLILKS